MKSAGAADGLQTRPGFLVAHQGGWDELLLVGGPLLVVGLLLWLANRRISAQLAENEGQDPEDRQDRDRTER